MDQEIEKLKVAVQKNGRLHDSTIRLIKECGLLIENGGSKLTVPISNFPAELLMLRDDDIPQYVADGVADIGIVGENVVLEKAREVDIIERLGFAFCRLSLAIPKSKSYSDLSYFQNKKIATSYPVIVRDFLDRNGIVAEIHEITGSVEIAPAIGLAEAVCDLVSTGSTLISNGLKEVETILRSEAVMVSGENMNEKKSHLINRLIFRIKAVKNAKNNKYILLNAPDKNIEAIKAVIPGMKSPTVMPLADKGWSSLHSVVNENDFWSKIEQLRSYGAEGILVIPIEKMIV